MFQNKLLNGLLLIMLLTNYSVAKTQSDPTRPAIKIGTTTGAEVVQDNDNIALNSIIQSATTTYAVINNHIYHRGEYVQGIKILQIGKDYISLADGRKLMLFTSVVRK